MPGKFGDVADELAEAFNTPAEIPAAALLAATAGLVGRAAAVRIKRGWLERPNLFLCLVAPSGVGKTPVCSFVFSFLSRLDAAKARVLDQIEEEAGYRPAGLGATILDDLTLPALADALLARPQGVLWVRDELAGLFREIHGNPAARARMITGYDSGPWKVDRVAKSRTKVIEAATLSVFGAIQPEIVTRCLTPDDFDSGLVARFLFVNAQAAPALQWSETEVTPRLEAFLARYFERLSAFERDPATDGYLFEVAPAAKRLFIDWYNQAGSAGSEWQGHSHSAAGQAGGVGGPGRETVTTTFGQCLRLSLVLHLMDCVAEDAMRPEVGEASMAAAIGLTEYSKAQQLAVHRLVAEATEAELYTEEQKRLARAVVSALPEAVGGIVPTQVATDHYNQGLEASLQLSSRSVGRLARSMKLRVGKHVPGRSCRGITVTGGELTRLKGIG